MLSSFQASSLILKDLGYYNFIISLFILLIRISIYAKVKIIDAFRYIILKLSFTDEVRYNIILSTSELKKIANQT